jgi:hypothetical protein
MSRSGRPTWISTAGLLTAAFVFRLLYGLSMPFWSEDERQVFLIGLRSFTRGEWPYFGADVVWSGGSVPGALLGWLVRGPLSVWPAPEAPVVLANILSFAALAFLVWYLAKRIPGVPRWLIASFLFTCPWAMNFSTQVLNPSYVLAGAIVFFVGFLEGFPAMRRGHVPFVLAWAGMGAGLFWVMQVHMSWVLLPPYVALATLGLLGGRLDRVGLTRGQALARAMAGFAVGAAVTGSLLVPTIVRYGLGAGHVEGVVAFQMQSAIGLLTTLARVLSFASFEINRFLGLTRAERVLVLWRQPWVVPFVLVVAVAGIVQPLWMVFTAFRHTADDATEWLQVRMITGATILLVYGSFFWSVRSPQAHSFYVVFPVAALFAASCWQVCTTASGAKWRRWERVAAGVIACGIVTHVGLAIDRWTRVSLYADRPLVAAAISDRNDRYLGDRRDTIDAIQDHRPRPEDRVSDPDAYMAARPTDDLQIVRQTWAPVAGQASRFAVTIANRSRTTAWLDIRFTSTFTDAIGRVVATHDGVIKRILQPAAAQGFDLADGDLPAGATTASLVISGAERAIPIRFSGYQALGSSGSRILRFGGE